ncbi:MAG: nuclear transport factor 2 family protein [Dermatophilaceae bacterium]
MRVGGGDLSESLRTAVENLLQAWLRADAGGLADAVADDVVAVGIGPHDLFVGRQAVVEAAHERAARGQAAQLTQPITVRHGLAVGGRSGWGWALAQDVAGPWPAQVLRASVAVARDHGRWRAVHLHVSFGLANEQLEEYRRVLPPLAPFGDDVSADARDLVRLLKASMGVQRLSLIADRPDVVVIGTDPEEVYEGAATYRAAVEPILAQAKELESVMQCEFPGGLRAALTPDRTTGFVAGNVVAAFGEQSLPPFRLGWVFTRLDDDFRLVCDHHSAAYVDRGPGVS